ncbi:MAG: integration host factor, actinobacterial type [Acidimicrobiia bacterium]
MSLPEQTPEQRAAALAKAGETRRVRAEVKQLLQMGTITFPELLERAETDDIIAGMKIGSVLPNLPGMGKVKTKRLLEELGIDDTRRIRGLGSRQRAALLDHLG